MKGSRLAAISFGVVAVAAASCRPSPVVDRRAIVLHAPRACAPGDGAYALFRAYGDFQPTTDAPVSEARFLADVGAELPGLRDDARSLVVDVSQGDGQWRASAVVASQGSVDALLWPAATPCALSASVGAHAGGLAAALDASHVLVVAGAAPAAGAPTPRSAVLDLATGAASVVSADLLVPRASGASLTVVGDAAVVAGGAGDQGTAERYVQNAGFDAAPIALSTPREGHAAALLATGEVLLVGGAGPGGTPLSRLEAVDPGGHRARTAGLVSLAFARTHATALRLADGEILVAGGEDASGALVSALEWIAPDGSHETRAPATLVTTRERGYVALPGGGALAVLVGDGPSFQNVWVVSAEGALEAAAPIAGTLTAARLFPASDGAPLLWTGDRWLRWAPWQGAFVPAAFVDGPGGPVGPAVDALGVVPAPDPGLALWVAAADGAVTGVRFSTKNAWTSDVGAKPLLHDGTDGLAPDRLVLPGVTSAIRFDANAGGLSLDEGASVVVTDTTYASFALDVDHAPGRAPIVVLRDAAGAAFEVGGAACPLAPDAASTHLHVERSGGEVRARTSSSLVTCATAIDSSARLSLGLRGAPGGGSTARDLVLARR